MSDRCDSCGATGDDLATVQRIYITFDEAQQPSGHRMSDEFETWCAACRVTYPHQEIDTSEA